MRVYLPATMPMLREFVAAGEIGPAPLTAFAVTPALRESYYDGDIEELEYAATVAAARASLRMLDADRSAPRRRVVVAADVADPSVRPHAAYAPAAVVLADAVPVSKVVSAHVDDLAVADVVTAAAEAVLAADDGDDDAEFLVDEAEAQPLQWYAAQELAALLAE